MYVSALLGYSLKGPSKTLCILLGFSDHLQFDYLASCKEPVTANSMIWSTGPEMLKWLKDPTSSTLQSTMCPVFGFRKLDPEDKGTPTEPHSNFSPL